MASSDQDLVRRARAGDQRAYGYLVERHRDVVFRVAARIAGRNDADDICQDTFVRAFYRLDQFAGRGEFRSWLLQVTRSVALNTLRKRVPEPVDGMDAIAGGADDGMGRLRPASQLESKERLERLEAKFGLLSDNHRTVLVLRDVEGLPYEQIAEITGAPIGSVKGRLHRARAEMIDLLRRNTYDWELPNR